MLLDRLLALAPNLLTAGELTPIQAWNDIRHRPQFGGLDAQCLRTLAKRLREEVKCHGYGSRKKEKDNEKKKKEPLQF